MEFAIIIGDFSLKALIFHCYKSYFKILGSHSVIEEQVKHSFSVTCMNKLISVSIGNACKLQRRQNTILEIIHLQ